MTVVHLLLVGGEPVTSRNTTMYRPIWLYLYTRRFRLKYAVRFLLGRFLRKQVAYL